MSDSLKTSPLLDATFDHALQGAAEKLRIGETFRPYLVQKSANKDEPFKIFEPLGEVPEKNLESLRAGKLDQDVDAYAIVFDGRVTLEGEKTDAVIVEGAERGGEAAQVWAVPYSRSPDTGEPEPRGLFRVGDAPSRFTSKVELEGGRSEERTKPAPTKNRIPACWISESAKSSPILSSYGTRYSDLIRRMVGASGRVSIGLSLDELLATLSGASVPSDLIEGIENMLEYIRSVSASTPGALGRTSNGLTRHPEHRPILFPDMMICCADANTKLFTPRGEAQLYQHGLNFYNDEVFADTSAPRSAPDHSSGVRLAQTGMRSVRFLFLPHPPRTGGPEIFRWIIDFFCEIAAAVSSDILSYWLKAMANYTELADSKNVDRSKRYYNSLFNVAVRHSHDTAIVDSGIIELLMAGARMRVEKEVIKELGEKAKTLDLFSPSESKSLFTPAIASRFVSFDRLFLLTRYGATLDNLDDASEEIIDYIVKSVSECQRETNLLLRIT